MESVFHVTNGAGLKGILQSGFIEPRIGERSALASEPDALVYAFHSRQDIEDAHWLIDSFEDWEYIFVLEIDNKDQLFGFYRGLAQYEVASTEKIRLSLVMNVVELDSQSQFQAVAEALKAVSDL